MRKKIIAVLCIALSLLSGVSVMAAFSDMPTDSNEQNIVDIMYDMGIMVGYEDGTFRPERAVSRAEFVTVIYNAMTHSYTSSSSDSSSTLADTSGFNWKQFYLGDGYSELYQLLTPDMGEDGAEAVNKSVFSDVAEDHWAYDEIRFVAMFGGVHGYEDGTFRPENTVTYDEAVTVLLSLCGYKDYALANGGFPQGFRSLASTYQLHKGVCATETAPMSRMDVASLIYNAFDLKLAPSSYVGEDTQNFLNDIMGVYILEGTLTGTDISSVYSTDVNKQNVMTIGENEFMTTSSSNIRDYIGRNIRVFLKKTADDEFIAESFSVTNRDKVTEIDISLIEEYTDNTFYYYEDAEYSKTKKITIENGSPMIYNGKNVGSYDEDFVNGFNVGTVKIIEKKDFDFDIIVVEDYESGYTENGMNTKYMEMLDNLKLGVVDNPMIELDVDDVEMKYQLFDDQGNEITAADIGEGAINYFINEDYAKIYYSKNQVSGKISSVKEEEGRVYAQIDGVYYPVSDAYYNYLDKNVRNGLEVNAYIDKFGEIVWYTETTSLDGYAYLIDVKINHEDEKLLLTYFDLSGGIKERVPTAGEIRYYSVYGDTEKCSYEDLYDKLKGKQTLVKIILDAQGQVKRVEEAVNKDVNAGGKIKKVLETNSDSSSEYYSENYAYYLNGFGGEYFLDGTSIVLKVPTDKSDYQSYKKATYKDISSGWASPVTIYSFDENAPYAKIAVIESNTTDSSMYIQRPDYFVMDVTHGINEDLELTTQLTLYDLSGGTIITATALETDEGGPFEKAYDIRTDPNYEDCEIGVGDIIHTIIDPTTNEIVKARVLYDNDGVNPAWCMNDAENVPTSCPSNHEHSIKTRGSVPGSTGFVEGSNTNNGNPFGYTNTMGLTQYDCVPGKIHVWQMYTYGYIYKYQDGLIRVTTQNLRENFKEADSNYYWSYDNPANASVLIATETEDGYTITKGKLSDIHTYEMVGSKCDRVMIFHASGSMFRILAFKDY